MLKLRSRDAIAAACVFVACREMKVTRTLKEICSVSTVPLKNVAKMSKLVMQIVGNCGLAESHQLVVRIFSRLAGRGLKVSNVVQNEAERVAKAADESSLLTGKQPGTIAAAAVYLVVSSAGLPIEIRDIHQTSDIAEATIKNSYGVLLQNRATLLTPEFLRE